MEKTKVSLIFPIWGKVKQEEILLPLIEEFEKSRYFLELVGLYDDVRLNKPSLGKFSRLISVKLLPYPLERFGKGFALCYGFNQSTGEKVFFWHGDFIILAKQLFLYLTLLDLFEADIVVGSKYHPLSQVNLDLTRRLFAKIYHRLIKTIFGFRINDTLVGLKLFQRKVLEKTIPKIIIKNVVFDLEVLTVASDLGFRKIIEAPIRIEGQFGRDQSSPKEIIGLLWETASVFYRKYLLNYYRQKFV